jgi:nucleoside-diphosphate-sugar epimerase
MKKTAVCLLGGTGFVGYHLANRLTHHGYTVNILTRRRERHRELLVNPAISLIEADVFNTDDLLQNFSVAGAVINLIGILNERNAREGSFTRIHADLPGLIAAAAATAGVPCLLHMSALHADPAEPHSRYLKTKGEGEDRVHAAASRDLRVTSFRPSVIFGPGDSFFNRFAALLRVSPLFFPLACPGSRFAPVYVGDVAEAFCKALADDATGGKRLELCGPDSYTLRELVVYTRDTLGLKKPVIGLGDALSRWQARLLGMLPGRPFTLDNYHSLQHDSLCTDNALPALGITPASLKTIVPTYLSGRNLRGRFHNFRRVARRQ